MIKTPLPPPSAERTENRERPARAAPARPLRALQLGLGWFPHGGGGLDRYFHGLLPALTASDVRCRGLVAGDQRIAAETGGAVTPFASPDASLLSRWKGVRAAFRALHSGTAEAPDLVAAHFACYAFPTLGLLDGAPLVVHFHGPWAAETRAAGAGRLATSFKSLVEKAVYRRGDRFIVLSHAFRDLLCRDYAVDPRQVHVVPGGVDTKRFDLPLTRSDARRMLGWPLSRPITLAVRRLTPRMGLENLICAATRLRQRVPDALILIAGGGKLAPALAAQIQAQGLENHVRMLGFVPDEQLPIAYRAADLTVVPSTSLEGFGLIAGESLAAGTPCLVTPVGGLPEVVRDLQSELILGGITADALADGLHRALAGNLSLPNAAACREYARTRFDWTTVASHVRQVYENVALP